MNDMARESHRVSFNWDDGTVTFDAVEYTVPIEVVRRIVGYYDDPQPATQLAMGTWSD